MSKLRRTIRLLFAGGGTGGHLFPAIAIADRLKELMEPNSEVEIRFVGTKRGLEYRMKDRLGYPLSVINVRGLARAFNLKNLLVPFLFVSSLIKSGIIIDQFKPDLVVGTGGYVSLPVLKMAVLKKIATVIQEQNSYPGMATRRLASDAKSVYLGFEDARKFIHTKGDIIVTGNPVRRSVLGADRAEAYEKFGLDPNKKTVLVLGGSQGARAVNAAVLRSLCGGSFSDEIQLLWQTGKRDYKDVIANAGDKADNHSLFPFEDRMDLVYAAADIAIARAGALTLAELHACGIPAVLIPLPRAAGDHQRKNARQAVESNHAIIIDQQDLHQHDLGKAITELFDSGKADSMRQAVVQSVRNKRPAIDTIAEDVLRLLELQTREDGGGS